MRGNYPRASAQKPTSCVVQHLAALSRRFIWSMLMRLTAILLLELTATGVALGAPAGRSRTDAGARSSALAVEAAEVRAALDTSVAARNRGDLEGNVAALQALARRTEEMTGIRFHPDHFTVKTRRDKFDRTTFEGRLGYQGPLVIPTWPRILFDITQHEPVINATVGRGVLHPYSDALPLDCSVRTYSFAELLAEKTRALYERTRPGDLYDVAYILDNLTEPLDRVLVKRTFEQKCAFKAIIPPTAIELVARVRDSSELRADWEDMLRISFRTSHRLMARLSDSNVRFPGWG